MSEAIFVEGLTKTYAGETVVDHLDLSVKSGNLPRTSGLRHPVVEHERIKADVRFA